MEPLVIYNQYREAYRRKIDEMKECVSGSRGWVRINTEDAAACDVSRGSLAMMARSLGLSVQRHGRYGFTCCRPSN